MSGTNPFPDVREIRTGRIELRVDSDGNIVVDGYATVYEHPYDVAGGPPYGWTETIARGACSACLRDDVRLLFDHTGLPLARTRSKTLTLREDDRGLAIEATLDPVNPIVIGLRSAMERGDVDEMSFAFRVNEQTWNSDYTERRIVSVKRLYDVSLVTYPANPATVAQLRAAAGIEELRTTAPSADTTSLSYVQAFAETLRARPA